MAEFKQARPVFFDLVRIRFPVGAVASIGHRVSGVVLVLFTPALIYLFDASLRSAQDYQRLGALLDHMLAKALALVIFWAFAHHFLAGIRHLLMDVDVGSSLTAARRSAWVVNVTSVSLALGAGWALL
ncbi:MAG TPA: succinate dehydrogenase, cytochrome b556 subunit [Burkholderiales bacterium]|nr:succinate dehydrogenase, cytochrome b556 subunit [Burkholderiales bacterium]